MSQEKKLLRYSQDLRKSMTKEERHLWYDFLKSYPIPFHRQYVIDNYIVDFYCHQAKLVIELDGGQHYYDKAAAYDSKRSAHIEKQGLSVLRFSNADIYQNFRGVCEMIDWTVQSRLHE